MRNPFKIIKYFLQYKKRLKDNKVYLETTYGFNIDRVYRLWTVIDLRNVPEDLIKSLTKENYENREIEKFISKFNSDLPRLGLDELVNFYDLKRINNMPVWGITFGYSQYNNVFIYLWLTLLLILIISASITIFLI